jgi:hypothetical protein
MVHAAMFDAMNAIRPYYTPAMVLITAKGYASREAAAAQAAHDVLLALFPAKQAYLDANLAASLAQIAADDKPGHRPKYEGIVTGKAAAAAVLNARQNDHAFDRVSFTPLSGDDGEYQFTPGCSATNISAPGWGNVTPFTVSDPDYFPTATKPVVTDPEWVAARDEVRAYGASNSTVRTPEQTQIGLFYMEQSMTLVNRLARDLVEHHEPVETNRAAASKQLLAHARLFAALNIAQADTNIRTWRVKYREHFWRPYTAIILLDPNWTPLRQTPCHPEFYAAHGTVTPAGITVIQNYLGHDAIDVYTTSTSLPGITRHYTSLNQMIQDVNGARIYAGFHYRSTLVRSNTLGIAVANWVNANMMTVLPESPVGPDDEDNDGHYVGISVQESYDQNNLENED